MQIIFDRKTGQEFAMKDRLIRLADIVERIAGDLGSDMPVSIECAIRGDALTIGVAETTFSLKSEDEFLLLEFEEVVDCMERLAQGRRMRDAIDAAHEDATAPWLVHSYRFMRDWLIWNGSGDDGAGWLADRTAIVDKSCEGSNQISVPIRTCKGGSINLTVAGGCVWSRVPLLNGFYDSTVSAIDLVSELPELFTILLNDSETYSQPVLLGNYFEMPGNVGASTEIAVANENGRGRIKLLDDFVPIAPIPSAAVAAIRKPGPSYAPWLTSDTISLGVGKLVEKAYALWGDPPL